MKIPECNYNNNCYLHVTRCKSHKSLKSSNTKSNSKYIDYHLNASSNKTVQKYINQRLNEKKNFSSSSFSFRNF